MLRKFISSFLLLPVLLAGAAFADGLPTRGQVGSAYATPAATAEPFKWTGLYLDLGAGHAWSPTEVSAYGVSVDSLSGDGWRGDGRIGVDVNMGPNLVAGVFGGYGYGSSEFSAGDFRAKLTPTFHVGSRVGVSSGGKHLWYAGAAWQQAELDLGGGDKTINGVKALAGVETYIAPQLTFAVEAGHTWYESQSVSSVRLEPTDLEIMGRIKWRPMTGLFND